MDKLQWSYRNVLICHRRAEKNKTGNQETEQTENKENDRLSSNMLTITLNVKSLNIPIKTQTLAEWIKKCNPRICCL